MLTAEQRRALAKRIQHRLAALPERWRWTLHNLIGHSLCEVLYQCGAHVLGDIVHDVTTPEPYRETPPRDR